METGGCPQLQREFIACMIRQSSAEETGMSDKQMQREPYYIQGDTKQNPGTCHIRLVPKQKWGSGIWSVVNAHARATLEKSLEATTKKATQLSSHPLGNTASERLARCSRAASSHPQNPQTYCGVLGKFSTAVNRPREPVNLGGREKTARCRGTNCMISFIWIL